jgi:hypothetical protein
LAFPDIKICLYRYSPDDKTPCPTPDLATGKLPMLSTQFASLLMRGVNYKRAGVIEGTAGARVGMQEFSPKSAAREAEADIESWATADSRRRLVIDLPYDRIRIALWAVTLAVVALGTCREGWLAVYGKDSALGTLPLVDFDSENAPESGGACSSSCLPPHCLRSTAAPSRTATGSRACRGVRLPVLR